MSERADQLDDVNFHCRSCGAKFVAAPARVEDAPDEPHHPWRYSAVCPSCGADAAQAGWERALLKAWTKATGPRSPAGVAAVAKNLEGHPTAEEALRTRFNAMKHGLSAKVATYFPAKPDRYARCKTCEIDRDWCAQQPACVKQQELFLLHHAAFESRSPKHLSSVYAGLQATVFAVVQEILQTIVADGVKLEAPEYYTDPSGRLIVASFIDEGGNRRIIRKIEAHPLFKPLAELLSRNNLSLADMGMTSKIIEDEDEALGRIKATENLPTTIENFSRQTQESLTALKGMIERAGARRSRDPIVIEQEKSEG